ncbi:MAG: hypothetical protein AVDCRST_MAG90-3230 [uncultured Microvirga sp.]|uniref:Uncharacterized protein n=1 Tax=uncultured Microvirga sp. TaxID=412392 RepID=A0A6J4MR10_9HYPH|nr:MAG: hypothetical protein AVDCRST_MAG90-3230 [uncultured Microvirga sp.]
MNQRLIIIAAVSLLASGSGLAQPRPGSGDETRIEVPGGDIFGFTDPADVGDAGDKSLGLETTTRIGKTRGLYASPTLKTELSHTIAPNLAVSLASFLTGHRIRAVPGLDDRSSVRFDGLSTEVLYRFLERGPGNPFAATFSFEPRISRVDELTGERATGYEAEFKLFLDAVLVPERLYGAVNLNYAVGAQRAPSGSGGTSEASSGTAISGALAYQLSERLFIGGEARWLTEFSGALLNDLSGQALFAGPTMLVKLSDKAAFNVSWTPQIAGRSQDNPGRRLDLDNFERHQLRVKFATNF